MIKFVANKMDKNVNQIMSIALKKESIQKELQSYPP